MADGRSGPSRRSCLRTDLIRWCATEKQHSVGTISRNMSVVAAAVNHGVKRILVEEDGVSREVQLPKYALPVTYKPEEISRLTGKPESKPRKWLPTFEEMARFIDAIGHRTASGDWDKHSENMFRFTVMAMNTWARPQAVLDLDVPKQVNFDAGFIDLNPPGRRQNKKVRPIIPLTDNLRAWLEHWAAGRPIPLTTIKKVFKRHTLECAMPQLTPYTIRHFMATHTRKIAGIDVSREQRKEWLGHKPQDTTSWYEHFDPEWLKEAKEATDAIMARLNGMLKSRTLSQSTPDQLPK